MVAQEKDVAAVIPTVTNRISITNLLCHPSESDNVKLLNGKDTSELALSEHGVTWIVTMR